ncbi:MAG: ribosome silencing factor [Ignavibacteria bacterium RBG_13_36_8]|nr:MAG: ribosome silencing factor [Ignavibacteria bacterium RBG_13_36_8]
MNSLTFAKKICESILSKRGYEIKILDLRKISSIADYFVICSADSDTQVKAIADEVQKKLNDEGIKCFHKEGYDTLNWVLLDYFDVVVHIFRAPARIYYNLEKLWGDAPSTEVKDEPAKSK